MFRLLCTCCQVAVFLAHMLAIYLASLFLLSRLPHIQRDAGNLAGRISNRLEEMILNTDVIQNCPAQGIGGDRQLNLLKNRIDTGNWMPIAFDQLAQLPYPPSVLDHEMKTWSKADALQVARSNGQPVSVQGYVLDVKRAHPEPANCNSHQNVDYHLLLGKSPTASPASAVVTEATPRIRVQHPGWTLERLRTVVSRQVPVRISGWTMLDPDDDGDRAGPWEVHPIMEIQVQLHGLWTRLDQAKL